MQILFSVFDKKLESYTAPFAAPNKAVVIREIQNNLHNHRDTPYATNPEDYAVYIVGTFDESNGVIVVPADTGRAVELAFEISDLVV